MRTYSLIEFFTYNANYNNILIVWINGREERLTLKKFEKLQKCNIMLEGTVYSVDSGTVRRVA